MLTPRQLLQDFHNFCTGKRCDNCSVYKLREACLQRSNLWIRCDTVWLIYKVLAERGLLYKNPNDAREYILNEDLQELVANITRKWCAYNTQTDGIPGNSFDEPINPSKCDSCPQRERCDKGPISCRLNFMLTNYRPLLDVIQHATTLRETC